MFRKEYGEVFKGDERWNSLDGAPGRPLRVGRAVDLRQEPAVLHRDARRSPPPVAEIKDARVLAVLGDSITTDHISPAGSIKVQSPAGKYLIEHGVGVADFNSYGSRRGNHEVMVRGTFANIRLRNKLAPAPKGASPATCPTARPLSIFDASERYREGGRPADHPGGQGIRLGLVARLGGQGAEAPRHPRRHRRELRADPSLEPGRHGHPPAPVRRRGQCREPRPDRRGGLLDRGPGRGARRGLRARPRRDRGGRARRRAQPPVQATVRIDTPQEIRYYEHGGILPYVLRQLLSGRGS